MGRGRGGGLGERAAWTAGVRGSRTGCTTWRGQLLFWNNCKWKVTLKIVQKKTQKIINEKILSTEEKAPKNKQKAPPMYRDTDITDLNQKMHEFTEHTSCFFSFKNIWQFFKVINDI